MTTTVEGAAQHAPTAGEYIKHHLGHLSNHHQHGPVDFSVIHYDTMFWSIAMGVLALLIMWMAARKATSGVPGRFQAAVEILVEMVDNQSKTIVHGDRSFIAPLALTVFVWTSCQSTCSRPPSTTSASNTCSRTTVSSRPPT
jgi:F-type H+-transporting ATPase subunit a